jgi:hypothetical protein
VTRLDASPGQGLDGKNLILSSGSPRRHAFLRRTQTLTKLKKTSKNKALPPTKTGIHCPSMALRPKEVRIITTAPTGGTKPYRLVFSRELE